MRDTAIIQPQSNRERLNRLKPGSAFASLETYEAVLSGVAPEAMEKILVTQVFMPPEDVYQHYLKQVWASGHVTNHGPLVAQLQQRLTAFLDVPSLAYVCNGTAALQVAYKALGLKGKVITTPFSYVATTSSLVWEGLEPVFVDICPETLTLDPAGLEAALEPGVEAILATHVYGNPCDVDAIECLAKKHGLRVIYDAAHAFGVTYQGQSLLNYGDVSTLSFHATKVFHTIEGGGIVCRDNAVAERVSRAMNFGHNGPESFDGVGINAKNSEFHAAMGLSNLPYWPEIEATRHAMSQRYDQLLEGHARISRPELRSGTDYNYAYYPVIFKSEADLYRVLRVLNAANIFPRRYFYPVLSQLPYVSSRQPLPVAESMASRVLCLPLFVGLSLDTIDRISRLILSALR
jgi:dTDP-4-amino-4,6-dideoxygalactose transaminase